MAEAPAKPGLKFYVTMIAVLFVTMVMHELVHLITAIFLGVETFAFGLSRVSYQLPVPASEFTTQAAIISISGPLFTLALGLFGAWIAVIRRNVFGYDLVLVALYQRIMAMAMSVVTGNHNDEARVSLDLGWDWWVLPAVFVSILAIAFVASTVRLRFGVLVFFLSYLTISVGYTALIYLDGQFPGQGVCDSIMTPFYDPHFGC